MHQLNIIWHQKPHLKLTIEARLLREVIYRQKYKIYFSTTEVNAGIYHKIIQSIRHLLSHYHRHGKNTDYDYYHILRPSVIFKI